MREAGVAAAASQFPIPVFRLLLPPFHLCSGFRFLLRFPPSHLAFSFLFFRFLLLLSLLLTLSLHQRRLKASRAPQLRGAEEAPLSERSEFGRRARRGEERRAPVRLHRTGLRRRQRFWFLLPRQKELAPQARKPCTRSAVLSDVPAISDKPIVAQAPQSTHPFVRSPGKASG